MNLDIYVSSYSSIISIYRCVPVCVRGLHRWIVQTLEWCRGDKSTGCPTGYREIILSSVKLKSTTQGRDSGGIIIWTNSELSIELVKSEQYHVAENKKRHYINISARLSVCHIYTTLGVSLFSRRNFSKHRARNRPFPDPGKCAVYG